MKRVCIVLALFAVLVVLLGFARAIVPTRYETETGMFVVQYKMSDVKCLAMPHDRWAQYPILCVKKDVNWQSFQPKRRVSSAARDIILAFVTPSPAYAQAHARQIPTSAEVTALKDCDPSGKPGLGAVLTLIILPFIALAPLAASDELAERQRAQRDASAPRS